MAVSFLKETNSAERKVVKKGLPMESKKALTMGRCLVDLKVLMTARSWVLLFMMAVEQGG